MKLIFSFQKGIAINFAPYRSKTLNKFVSIAETYSFECNVYEQYDEDVFNKHLQVNLFFRKKKQKNLILVSANQ
jgi:hypothetical protein